MFRNGDVEMLRKVNSTGNRSAIIVHRVADSGALPKKIDRRHVPNNKFVAELILASTSARNVPEGHTGNMNPQSSTANENLVC